MSFFVGGIYLFFYGYRGYLLREDRLRVIIVILSYLVLNFFEFIDSFGKNYCFSNK